MQQEDTELVTQEDTEVDMAGATDTAKVIAFTEHFFFLIPFACRIYFGTCTKRYNFIYRIWI